MHNFAFRMNELYNIKYPQKNEALQILPQMPVDRWHFAGVVGRMAAYLTGGT